MKTKMTTRMKALMFMLALIFSFTTTETQAQKKTKVYDIVEVMPQYPGGMQELMQYLAKNIKYPPKAEKKGIEGKVMINFIVEKDGSISNVKIVRHIHPLLDKEAERVIKAMPRWSPGKQEGKPVRVKFNIPVAFRLK